MVTSAEIKKRAKALAEKTNVESIGPMEVGNLMYDSVEYAEEVERNGGTLGIRKVYTSVVAMEADAVAPVDLWGNKLKRGNLVVVYDGTATGVDNNKVYAFLKPGWKLVTKVDAGYASRGEIAELPYKFLPDRSYGGYASIDYNHLVNIASGGVFTRYVESLEYDCAWVQIFSASGALEISGCVVCLVAWFSSLQPTAESYIGASSSSFAIPDGAKLCIVDLEKKNNPDGYMNMRVRQISSGADRSELNAVADTVMSTRLALDSVFSDSYTLMVKDDDQVLSPELLEGQWFNPLTNALVTNANYKCYRLDVTDLRNNMLHIVSQTSGNMWSVSLTDGTNVLDKYDYTNGNQINVDRVLLISTFASVLYVNCRIVYNDAYVATISSEKNTNRYDIAPVNTKMRDVTSFSGEPFVLYDRYISIGEAVPKVTGNMYYGANFDMCVIKLFGTDPLIVENGIAAFFVFYKSDEIKASNYLSYNTTGSYVSGATYCGILFKKVDNPKGLKKLRIVQNGTVLKHEGVLREAVYEEVEKVSDTAGYFIHLDGTVRANASFHYARFDIADCLEKSLVFSSGIGGNTGIAFAHYYDSNDVWLGCEYYFQTPAGGGKVLTNEPLHPPLSSAYLLINANNSNTQALKQVIVGSYYDFSKMRNDIKELKEGGSGGKKLMKVHLYGVETALGNDLFYIRTSYNKKKTKDILLVYYTNVNGLISPKAAYVGDPMLADSELMTSEHLVSSHSDSTAPLFNSSVYWHLFAQHGYVIPRISNTVGMTSADVGAKWKDQLNREYTIGNVTPDVISLLPVIIRGEEGNDTRGWKTPNDTAIVTFRHISGGVVTSTFQATNLSSTQLRPIMKSYNRKFGVDGQEITAAGDYYCDEFSASESQIGYDPASIEIWFPTPDLNGVLEMARFTWSYNFKGAQCCVNTTIDIRRKVECQSYGATQQQTFLDKGDYKAMFMIPKASARSGKELDKPFHSPATSSPSYSFYRNATSLKDVDKPIDRLVAFLHNPEDNSYLVGMAAGLSLVSGDTTTEKRNANIPVGETDAHFRLGSLSPSNTNKFYVAAVNTAAFAADGYNFPNTYFKEINYYVSYFDPEENVGQVFWYKDGNCYVIYAHCQSRQNRIALELPDFMEGLSVDVVEKTDETVLLTSTIQNGNLFVNYNTDDGNYMVLKTR